MVWGMHELGGSWQPLSHRRNYGQICILQKKSICMELEEENVIFQCKNDPKYLSKYIKDWLLA
jgi:hypothetical protein